MVTEGMEATELEATVDTVDTAMEDTVDTAMEDMVDTAMEDTEVMVAMEDTEDMEDMDTVITTEATEDTDMAAMVDTAMEENTKPASNWTICDFINLLFNKMISLLVLRCIHYVMSLILQI